MTINYAYSDYSSTAKGLRILSSRGLLTVLPFNLSAETVLIYRSPSGTKQRTTVKNIIRSMLGIDLRSGCCATFAGDIWWNRGLVLASDILRNIDTLATVSVNEEGAIVGLTPIVRTKPYSDPLADISSYPVTPGDNVFLSSIVLALSDRIMLRGVITERPSNLPNVVVDLSDIQYTDPRWDMKLSDFFGVNLPASENSWINQDMNPVNWDIYNYESLFVQEGNLRTVEQYTSGIGNSKILWPVDSTKDLVVLGSWTMHMPSSTTVPLVSNLISVQDTVPASNTVPVNSAHGDLASASATNRRYMAAYWHTRITNVTADDGPLVANQPVGAWKGKFAISAVAEIAPNAVPTYYTVFGAHKIVPIDAKHCALLSGTVSGTGEFVPSATVDTFPIGSVVVMLQRAYSPLGGIQPVTILQPELYANIYQAVTGNGTPVLSLGGSGLVTPAGRLVHTAFEQELTVTAAPAGSQYADLLTIYKIPES